MGSDADDQQMLLVAATEAARRKAMAEEHRVHQAEQRAADARTSSTSARRRAGTEESDGDSVNPSEADIARMISNQMVEALDQAAVGLLGGDDTAVKTVSAARQEAETVAGK